MKGLRVIRIKEYRNRVIVTYNKNFSHTQTEIIKEVWFLFILLWKSRRVQSDNL